jgi:hypothetical protein
MRNMSEHYMFKDCDGAVHEEPSRREALRQQAPTSAPRTTPVESSARESHDQLVTCPRCGQQFPLTDALAEELAGHVLAGKEPALREQIARDVQARYAQDLQEMQGKLHEQEEALQQDSEVIKKLRNDEVQLRQDRRKLEDDRDALQAEKERMRDEIRKQERDEAERKTQERYEAELRQKDEAHAVEVRELEEKLNRVNTQLDQARRKGAMGSRQEEGFTQQDLFAEELRRRFPADEITVTPRGVTGADVAQTVRLGGRDCGVILWECKRAASWSGNWIGKLADDVAKAGADMGVIVSAELPAGMDNSGLIDGIWVTDYPHAPTLAAGLREAVTTAWRYKLANADRDNTAAKVYDYIATGGFADRYAAAERALDAQLETLRKEKRYYAQSWAQREQQIEKTRANLTGMVGDLIRVGAELSATALAELPTFDLAALPQAGVPALPSALA